MRVLHFSVIKAADDVAASVSLEKKVDVKFGDEVLSQVTSFIWDTVSQDWSNDLIAFSSHANRVTANADDALLLTRRNASLEGLVKKMTGITSDQTKARGVKRPRPGVSSKRAAKATDPTPSFSTSTPRPTKNTSAACNPDIVLTPVSSKPSSSLKALSMRQNSANKDSFDVEWLEDEPMKTTNEPSTSNRQPENGKKSTTLPETICLDDSFEEDCFGQTEGFVKEEHKNADISRPICSPSPKPTLGAMMNSLPNANDDSDFSDFD